ncbi:MAG TPA: hypothetical protein VGL99_09735 [Chloroflexota bacterium]
MAVRAADVALADLDLDAPPTVVVEHVADVELLGRGVAMIEVEHERVRLGTVDARMR